MAMQSTPQVSEIFANWQRQNHDLDDRLDDLRGWIDQHFPAGRSSVEPEAFQEMSVRLLAIRDKLHLHFDDEDTMIERLSRAYPAETPEIEAVRRQSARDHNRLLAKLDTLIVRFEIDVHDSSLGEIAVAEIDSFMDALEQHEDQEYESVTALMPASNC